MMWDLPIAVEIDGVLYNIRDKCDYRIVLDTIGALNDDELGDKEKIQCALFIFYEDLEGCKNFEQAVKEMYKIISYGEDCDSEEQGEKPKLMDWQQDFQIVVPPINRTLGYDVRTPDKYTHWYTFLGGYMEIGECTFSNVVSIRSKRAKGKRLEKWEQEFYKENRKMIDLPINLTEDEQEWLLDTDW